MPGFAELDRLSKPTPPKQVSIGFAFDETMSGVALIEKRGRGRYAGWNAIGGHIEQGETPLEAMEREFWEEAGLNCPRWKRFSVVHTSQFVIHCFRTKTPFLHAVTTKTDEVVQVFAVNHIPDNTVYDVKWLLQMAISAPEGFEFEMFERPVAA